MYYNVTYILYSSKRLECIFLNYSYRNNFKINCDSLHLLECIRAV